MLLLTFVPHGYKDEDVEMRELMNVSCRRQETVRLGDLGESVHSTPTLIIYDQYRFSQSFSLVTNNQGLLKNAAALRKCRVPRAQFFNFRCGRGFI